MNPYCKSTDCDVAAPHHHGVAFNHYGEPVPVTFYESEDPRAEVRDPDTGEVIFPAVKGPLRVIEGGKVGARELGQEEL